VAGERRDLDDRVDGGDISNKQHRGDPQQVGSGHEAGNLSVNDAIGELTDDVQHAGCDDLVERILNESLEPAPEEPIELRNDKEGNKYRPEEDANGGGDHSEGHDNERQSLGDDGSEPQKCIEECGDWLCDSRRFKVA